MIIFNSRVAPQGIELGHQVLPRMKVQFINNRPHSLVLNEIRALNPAKEPKMSTEMINFAQNWLQTPIFPSIFIILTHLIQTTTIVQSLHKKLAL